MFTPQDLSLPASLKPLLWSFTLLYTIQPNTAACPLSHRSVITAVQWLGELERGCPFLAMISQTLLSGCDPVQQDQAWRAGTLRAASVFRNPVWYIKAPALVWPQPVFLALLEESKMGTTKMGWWAAGTGESTCVTSSLSPPILLEWAENHNQWRHFRIWHRMWLLTKSFFS